MRLSYRQQRQLRLIEATVRRSDPQLRAAVTMATAGRRAPAQTPAAQRERTRPRLDGPAR